MVRMEEEMIKMVIECQCEKCYKKLICNSTDLINCYAKKRLTIKG